MRLGTVPYVVLLLCLTPAARAADSRAEAAKEANETRLKVELKDLKGYLEEAHAGKRSEAERYVILHRMLQDYGLLKSTKSPEAQGAIREWHALLKAHPEYRVQPPRLEIREQRQAREAGEAAEAERKRKLPQWTARDDIPIAVYGLGQKAVAEYQYKLAFFHLPDELKIEKDSDQNKFFHALQEKRLAPFKTMTFKHRIDNPWLPSEPFDHPIWFCTNEAANYVATSDEERTVIGWHGKQWKNENGELDDFCGAVSLDGNVIFQLPDRQHYPDHLFKVLQLTKDGNTAAIGVGKATSASVDEGAEIGALSEVIVWQYPDRIERISLADKASAKAALKRRRLSPVIIGEQP